MNSKEKQRLLKKSIILDLIGMSTIFIPYVGFVFDFLWAPYAARKMRKMYPGRKGKIAALFVFMEEILPFTDVIPSFTIMYIYEYVWKKSPVSKLAEA